ncbi:MAG: quinol:cytochrome C oxidoreductase [Cyclobacteriaceae bacterium]|nr:quinol:cytochrome C oxidoreductase [Cyclobacteriaceae bacterium]
MSEDKFIFTAESKKKIFIMLGLGIVLTILGIITVGGHAHEDGNGHAFHWLHRLYANLWLNNVFVTGIAVIGVFFLAIQYAAMAGWSAYIKRIPEAFGYWLPIAGVLTLVLFFITNFTAPHHFHIFHWLDSSLYEVGGDNYDYIIANKQGYLNVPFFLFRMIAYFVLWSLMFFLIRKYSIREDELGGTEQWSKMRISSTVFIIIFAITSSTSAWDWVLSIDTHWFSTMFGWYMFSSWFVAGLSVITLTIIILYENGYLQNLNSSHLHDLGKFIFAFSVFWAYIWFSQFMLIYYANIPEETYYFLERMKSDVYAPLFYANIFINFVFPFLFLMTRDAKRHTIFLKIVCVALIFGHWLDFFLMIMPGTISENGGIGFMEIGLFLVFASGFLFVLLQSLAKAPLVAKNHPMLQESLHHHI